MGKQSKFRIEEFADFRENIVVLNKVLVMAPLSRQCEVSIIASNG